MKGRGANYKVQTLPSDLPIAQRIIATHIHIYHHLLLLPSHILLLVFKMQLEIFYIAALAALATASPLFSRDVASCEVVAAAQQVACTGDCAGNAACKSGWYVFYLPVGSGHHHT